MKYSIFTVATPDLSPDELAASAAKAGIHGIEWRYKSIPADKMNEKPSFWGRNLCSIPEGADESVLQGFQEAADRHGVTSIAVVPYLPVGDLAAAEQVLRAARKLGAGFVRLGVPGYNGTRPYGDLFSEAAAYLEACVPLCRQYGVKGLIETHHGTIAASASGAMRLVERLPADSIGVLYDPGNLVHEGFEAIRMGLELLGPYLAHVHVKNTGWRESGRREDGSLAWTSEWRALDEGVVHWPHVIKALQAVGYDGYLGLEDFSGTRGSLEMLAHYVGWLDRMMA